MPVAANTEREQQFTYYWYAAKQAFTAQNYTNALALFHFCNQINPTDATTCSYLGILYSALNQKEQAKYYFQQAYQLEPTDNWFQYCTLVADEKEALQVLEHVTTLNAKDDKALAKLRDLYIRDGQYKQALQTQQQLDKLIGYDAYSALYYCRIHTLSGNYKKATQALDTYLEQDPTNLQFLLYKLEILERTYNNSRKAEKTLVDLYEQILVLDPNNVYVLNNYAYHLAITGQDLKRAERMSERAIREEPDEPSFLDTYGWILHLQGQDNLALFYLKRALQYAEGKTLEVIKEHIKLIEQ